MAATTFIFDLDGTIWNSKNFYAEIIADVGGNSASTLNDLRAGYAAATLLRRAGVTPRSFEQMTLSCRYRLPLYPGIKKVINNLRIKGIPMGIVTSLPNWIAGPMLDKTGLMNMFGIVIDWNRCKSHKPSPKPLLIALENLRIKTNPDAWYVGDMVADAQAAKSADLSFAWASYGYGEIEPAGTDMILKSPGDLLEL